MLNRRAVLAGLALLVCSCSSSDERSDVTAGQIRVPPIGAEAGPARESYAGVQPYLDVPEGLDCDEAASFLGQHLGASVEAVTDGRPPAGVNNWYRLDDGSFVVGELAEEDYEGGMVYILTAYAYSAIFYDARQGNLGAGCTADPSFFEQVLAHTPAEAVLALERDVSLESVEGGPLGLLNRLAEQMRAFVGAGS